MEDITSESGLGGRTTTPMGAVGGGGGGGGEARPRDSVSPAVLYCEGRDCPPAVLIDPPNRFPGGGGGDKLRSRVSDVTGGVRGMAPVCENGSGDGSTATGVWGGGGGALVEL